MKKNLMNVSANSQRTWLLLISARAILLLGNLVKLLVVIIIIFYALFLLFPFVILTLLGVLLFLTFAKLRQMLFHQTLIVDWLKLTLQVERSDTFANTSANQSSKAAEHD